MIHSSNQKLEDDGITCIFTIDRLDYQRGIVDGIYLAQLGDKWAGRICVNVKCLSQEKDGPVELTYTWKDIKEDETKKTEV